MFLDSVVRRIFEPAGSRGAARTLSRVPLQASASIARTLERGLPLMADASGALARLAVLPPTQVMPPTPGEIATLGFIRSRPLQGSLDVLAAPAWAHGMAIVATSGPFNDEYGVPIWIDTILPLPKKIEIARDPGGKPIAFLQSASVKETSTGGTTTVTFAAGSLWLVAPLLAKAAPANGYAGIAFASAKLTVRGSVSISPGRDVLSIGPAVTAELEIAPAAAPAPPPGMQNDGTGTVASLPKTVRFALAPDGTHVTALSDATLTVYDTAAGLAGGPTSVAYDADLTEITVAYGAVTTPLEVTIPSSKSPTFQLRGTARVLGGSYRIPVAQTNPDALGPAASGGALGLALRPGLTGQFGNLEAPVALGATLLHAQTGILAIVARTTKRPFSDAYALWDAPSADGQTRATSIALAGPRGTLIRTVESGQGEIVTATGCRVDAHIDRPLLANGSAPSVAALSGGYALVRTAMDEYLLIEAAALPTATGVVAHRIASYVIENAVLRTRGVDALFAFAKLTAQRAAQGVLFLGHALDRVTPTLPDPYAANLDPYRENAPEQLVGVVGWASPSQPQLAFAIQHPQQSHAGAVFGNENAGAPEAAFVAARGGISTLYDVSSAQSQFGVAATAAALFGGQILGQRLAVSAQQSALFTVPAIAWEPVLNPNRSWFFPIAVDDGPPTLVSVPTVALRPLEPGAFLDAFFADYAKGADLIAEITLPFGLTATIDTRADNNTAPPIPRPELHVAEPQFADQLREGGKQLSIRAVYDPKTGHTVLPGTARAGNPLDGSPDPDPDSNYVHAVLDDTPAHDMAGFWNQDFGGDPPPPTTHFVPVSRYDLSGYGASPFSDYVKPGAETGIVQARFDVIVGRTLYELVQEQSYILPWHIPVVNTTIFQRDAAGYVLRYNSGWRAKAEGIFAYPGVAAGDIERGGVLGVYNVRNIVELPGTITVSGNPPTPKEFSRVTFDADVHLLVAGPGALTVTGGAPSGFIPSSGLTGYLELTAKDNPTVATAIDLLDQHGIADGPLAAAIEVKGTGIAMALTGVEVVGTRPDVVRSPGLPRTLAVALRGTPLLPRDGSWSIGSRPHTSTVPQPIAPSVPVPLVRPVATPDTWHIADAADVVKLDDPLRFYGFLQATGANKVFFEHPTIRNLPATNPLNFKQTPKLADVGKLLGDNGLLPDILSLLDFGAFDGLKKAGDGFALKKTLTNKVDLGNRVLIPLGPIRLLMASWSDPPGQPTPTTIRLDLDATGNPRWAIAIQNIAFKLAISGWGDDTDPLITVHGDATAQEGSRPTFSNIAVKYGTALAEIQQILTEVEQIIQFLPSKEKTGLDVSFAGSKLRIRENFPLPKLPLGLGYIEDFSLDLGFDIDVLDKKLSFFVGLGDDQNPFHWLVSPLSGNGMLQLGATDKLGVVMQAGIGVGLAIDFAIVSGSASIVIAVRFDATRNPIAVMVLLTGQASVDVLDGLASASLTLTAGVGVAVQPGPAHLLTDIPPDPIEFLKETVVTLSAEVAVGIHISVCWLVHIDFDGSWPFSETISGKTLTALI